jgi:hypothetical protein
MSPPLRRRLRHCLFQAAGISAEPGYPVAWMATHALCVANLATLPRPRLPPFAQPTTNHQPPTVVRHHSRPTRTTFARSPPAEPTGPPPPCFGFDAPQYPALMLAPDRSPPPCPTHARSFARLTDALKNVRVRPHQPVLQLITHPPAGVQTPVQTLQYRLLEEDLDAVSARVEVGNGHLCVCVLCVCVWGGGSDHGAGGGEAQAGGAGSIYIFEFGELFWPPPNSS